MKPILVFLFCLFSLTIWGQDQSIGSLNGNIVIRGGAKITNVPIGDTIDNILTFDTTNGGMVRRVTRAGLIGTTTDITFANTNLTFTGDRTHNGNSHSLLINNLSSFKTASSNALISMADTGINITNFDLSGYVNIEGMNGSFNLGTSEAKLLHNSKITLDAAQFHLDGLTGGTGAGYVLTDVAGNGNLTLVAPTTGGSGTVTSFSAGDLSPLFTTSEATTTTTPALTFNLSNAGANTYFGNNTGSSAAPAFHTFPAALDTANKWITTFYKRNDSVFYVKGGNETFAFKDSVGSGGGGLVTSVFGRTGAVTAQGGDYDYSQISNTPVVLRDSGTLDFADMSFPPATLSLNITVNGAAVGDFVIVAPPASMTLLDGIAFTAWVTAAATVSVYCHYYSDTPVNPPSGVFKVMVIK